jgi:uncharacterized metal-binding protein
MVELPKKKVGIVACSGEELPEGTISRLAALKVLEQMRTQDTVTICLPLFLAGGEGDRAFARFYPTIAIDGCEKRCAARGTERYSGKPAASIVVNELMDEAGYAKPSGARRLDEAGLKGVDLVAERTVELIDELLGKKWNRKDGQFREKSELGPAPEEAGEPVTATCACGSGIPIQTLVINGQEVTLVALPLIFEKSYETGKKPGPDTQKELMEMVNIYNPIPVEANQDYAESILLAYTEFIQGKEAQE